MKEKIFLEMVNNFLSKYNIKVVGIGEEKSSILAYYELGVGISINKHNKQVFNDYLMFMEVMFHENIHEINFFNGIEDTFMDGQKQIHNDKFREMFYDKYQITPDERRYNGLVNWKDKINEEALKRLILSKIEEQDFKELQKYFLEEIYEYSEEHEEKEKLDDEYDNEEAEVDKYKENEDEYIFDEEGGIEI